MGQFFTVSSLGDNRFGAGGFWGHLVDRLSYRPDKINELKHPRVQCSHGKVSLYFDADGACTLHIPSISNESLWQKGQTLIWLPNQLFEGQPNIPDDIIIGGRTCKKENFVKNAIANSVGTLYRYTGGSANTGEFFQLTLKDGAPPKKAIQFTGYWNPLVLTFSTTRANLFPGGRNVDLNNLLEGYLDQHHLVDLVVEDTRSLAPLRHNLTQYIAALIDLNKQDTLLHKLYFTKKDEWGVRELPFLVLDTFGGHFIVDNHLDNNHLDIRWRAADDCNTWLVKWCLARLNIKECDQPEFPNQAIPCPRENDNFMKGLYLKNAQMAFPKLFTSDEFIQCFVGQQKKEGEDQRDQITAMINSCIDGHRFYITRFVAQFSREFLLPKSPIWITLPQAPVDLPDVDKELWNEHRNSYAVDLLDSPLAAEKRWLNLLLAPINDAGLEWYFDDGCWFREFYRSVFTSPPKQQISWSYKTSGIMGFGKLGTFPLGCGFNNIGITGFQLV